MADEIGWVIEHKNSEPSAPPYWAGNGWEKDNLRAIRFARQVDAERTAKGFDEDDPLPHEGEHRICEHMWSDIPRRDFSRPTMGLR